MPLLCGVMVQLKHADEGEFMASKFEFGTFISVGTFSIQLPCKQGRLAD